MEERPSLTEKEMAIEMWERIKKNIHYLGPKNALINVGLLKYEYLKEHNMLEKWENMCILCQKYDNECPKCPLQSCMNNQKTLWAIVVNKVYDSKTGTYISPFTSEERLDACDKIIEAIKNDIPDDYKS